MKKILIFSFIIVSIMFSFSSFASPSQKAFAASIQDNSVIILSGKVNDQNKLVLSANLEVNTGIGAMTLELSYDKTAMLLTNVVFGSALSELEPITTDTDTTEGFSITPFKFNYLSKGKENDTSTGNLFTLTFDLKDSIKDGIYKVSLKYGKNRDVNYFENGEVKTKNLYIDNAEIHIKNNSVTDIKSVTDESNQSKVWIIALCISIPVVVASGVFVALRLLKKKRNWKRI